MRPLTSNERGVLWTIGAIAIAAFLVLYLGWAFERDAQHRLVTRCDQIGWLVAKVRDVDAGMTAQAACLTVGR
jgi:hypothetical protein